MSEIESVFKNRIHGKARIVDVDARGAHTPLMAYRSNLIMSDWASIFANFAVTGLSAYRISGMYLEYENVTAPEDVVAVPTFLETEGITYYDGLALHPTRDYLRVVLSGANISTTNISQWPFGNVAQFFAMSTGVIGTHGKIFSDTVNSKLFGAALVAVRNIADPTQDLVMSRLYFSSDEQQVKLPSSQLGVDWALEFN